MNMEQKQRLGEWRRGLRDTLPMLLALIPFGLILGAQAAQKGLSMLEIMLMMGMNFAGSSEMAAMDLWQQPIPIFSIWLVTFLLNSRYILMGASLSPHLRPLPPWQAFLSIALMIDENWALAMQNQAKRKRFSFHYYMASACSLYVLWIALGALGHQWGLNDALASLGLEIAIVAIFVCIIRGMHRRARESLPWLISFMVAGVLCLLFPQSPIYMLGGSLSGLAFVFFFPAGKKQS